MQLTGRDLACIRSGRLVFEALDFRVDAGTLLQLRGRNGAGKSSLLRLIAGLVRIAEGDLALEGGAPDVPVKEHIHYVGHLDAIKPALSVVENLAFWARLLEGEEVAALAGQTAIDPPAALDAMGIGPLADFPAAILSAGQRRRLSLARLLVAARPVWLLDEPTTALDTDGQACLFRMVEHHLSSGGLALIATHVDLPLPAETLTLGLPQPEPQPEIEPA